MIPEHSVVVGVDGSRESLQAVVWAAADASRRGRPLHIAHTFTRLPVYAPIAAQALAQLERGMHEAANAIISEASERAQAVAPGVRLTTSIQIESPAQPLLRASERADTLVVGNRGRGGFAGLLLGSVSIELAAHASCPVVIVREADRPPGSEAGRVVIGVDGSHDADRALQFAFEQASYRGIGLTAVLAYDPDLPSHRDDLEDLERRTLAESTAGWTGKYPDVDFRQDLVRGGAAERLTERSAGAELLVVGSRGRGGFRGLLLGSVSQIAIQHAACPVAVVR
ncbi:universal stress protein [Dactylosporangium sp. CS-033363]|uniref:universal stress protein n=1 Tax=Dactylosporangium sp. CS-033363 TaxID=3239935 RepID=UPI003D92E78F